MSEVEIKDIVTDIVNGKEPNSKINDVILNKIHDSLESKRIEVATKIYNEKEGV